MYGVNVKPYKKGAENSPAWDICTVHRSFNAIGPTHSKPRPMILPGDWGNAGRIFDSEEITYPKIDDIHRDSFIEWMYNSYGVDVSPDFKKNKGLYTYLKRYNFEKANGTLMKISSAIMKSDRDYLSAIRDRMPEEMKNKKIIDSR
jgi:hypothetical protein